MKTWVTILILMAISWSLTDVRSGGIFQSLFAPLFFTGLVLIVLVKVLLKLGITKGSGIDGTGGDSGGSSGGDCGGDGGGC
ncbi:hypothetical protein [Psychromonas aquimarina]|uniref:hypothetical protein n=1 Tax=Psychromonas aquimarina TaxID=444919 RepID=UPI0012F818BE|nr:hypothetical protein [Psychromonas aquimarina]